MSEVRASATASHDSVGLDVEVFISVVEIMVIQDGEGVAKKVTFWIQIHSRV